MIQRAESEAKPVDENEPPEKLPDGSLPDGPEEMTRLPADDEQAEGSEDGVSEDRGSEDGGSEDRVSEDIALLIPQLEALLFVAREPLSLGRLAEAVGCDKTAARAALNALAERFSGDESGVHLIEIAGGWRLLSNPAFADAVAALHGQKAADRLSAAALETLAVIAYKQPAGRAEIERVRGVGAGPVLRHLLELDLIKVAGRDEGLGRALLYGTTREFLDRFGLGSLRDLPASLDE